MLTYVLRRLVLMLPVAFLVTVGVFMLIHLTPGDPALIVLGEDRSPQAIAAIHQQLASTSRSTSSTSSGSAASLTATSGARSRPISPSARRSPSGSRLPSSSAPRRCCGR
jgi:ABC-type microcin C transport system permease subunit YejB